jgi:hypothetical protein
VTSFLSEEMPNHLAKIVSVACLEDLAAWSVTARFLKDTIPADRYEVIVPAQEVGAFRKITPPSIAVSNEQVYLGKHSIQSIRSALPASIRQRAGWYLQQFIKLEACRQGRPDDIALIWDADTVPLKPIRIVDETGRLNYYKSSEFHAPYFETIFALTGLEKATDFSFIAQCFPTRTRWVNELIDLIEKRTGQPWIDAVLLSVRGKSDYEFSEYETLGQYIHAFHREDVVYSERRWHRNGNSLIGGPGKLNPRRIRKLAVEYDFLSFESWDPVLETRLEKFGRRIGRVWSRFRTLFGRSDSSL